MGTQRFPTHFPDNINVFVPDCSYAADVMNSGDYVAELGAIPAADSDFFMTTHGTSLTTAYAWTLSDMDTSEVDHRYGVALVADASTAAAARALTVSGYDYLQQYMQETLTLPTTTVAVAGVKAFKRVIAADLAGGAARGNVTIGFGKVLGLPYQAKAVVKEFVDDVLTDSGTFVAGYDTASQTATTADPRGTYAPAGTPDGSKEWSVAVYCRRANLHGEPQYPTNAKYADRY